MEPRLDKPEHPPLNPSPMRILVQTLTHLIPSDKVIPDPEQDPYGDKLISMLNRICELTWDFEWRPGLQRWYEYGLDNLGYNSRPCFFLVDYGTTDDDASVPIRAYEWDGKEFKLMPELLQEDLVKEELAKIPFTPRPRTAARNVWPVREIVRTRLRSTQRVPTRELEHLKNNPEDMEWLKTKLRPRFYANLLAQIESRPRELEEEEREKNEMVLGTFGQESGEDGDDDGGGSEDRGEGRS